jgi:hypothetical protein
MLLAALACSDNVIPAEPTFDSFYFPAGLAVRHQPPGCAAGTAGCQSQLLVTSSNFDLRFDPAIGGTLIAVDVDRALAQAAAGGPSPLPVTPLGAVQIGSFGGELAVVDPETCPGWTGPAQALVASRSQGNLHRVDIDAAGGLSCGESCIVPLDRKLADPFGVTVACGTFAPAPGAPPSPQALAFVTHLRAADAHGWLSRVDLRATDGAGRLTSPISLVDLQLAPTGQAAFDAASARLYVTGRFATVGYSPLRWVEVASPGSTPGTTNLFTAIRGADPRGIALSTDRSRAYVAVRLYDPDVALLFNGRPILDSAGALAVLDITELPEGGPSARLLQLVPLDRGATEVRVLPRAGRRDLVVTTSTDDSTVTLYDDELGLVARTFAVCGIPGATDAAPAPCQAGAPSVGTQPFGLAVEPLASGLARIYVGSFDRGFVNVLQLDPLRPSAAPTAWIRIGPERP